MAVVRAHGKPLYTGTALERDAFLSADPGSWFLSNDGELRWFDGVAWQPFGDMFKSVYDTDDDGSVEEADHAAAADAVPWSGVSGKPSTFTPSAHTHAGGDVTTAVAEATHAASADAADEATHATSADSATTAGSATTATTAGDSDTLDTHHASEFSPAAQEKIFTADGVLTAAADPLRIYNQSGSSRTITKVKIAVNTAPTGAAIIVDVHKNGTTIFTTQSNRPQIADGANEGYTTTIEVPTWADGEYLQIQIDQIGSTVAGSDLTVVIVYTQGL